MNAILIVSKSLPWIGRLAGIAPVAGSRGARRRPVAACGAGGRITNR
jgi:hypothetical protein